MTNIKTEAVLPDQERCKAIEEKVALGCELTPAVLRWVINTSHKSSYSFIRIGSSIMICSNIRNHENMQYRYFIEHREVDFNTLSASNFDGGVLLVEQKSDTKQVALITSDMSATMNSFAGNALVLDPQNRTLTLETLKSLASTISSNVIVYDHDQNQELLERYQI